MGRDRAIRIGLWVSVLMSAMAVVVFVPLALSQESSLVPVAPPRHVVAQQIVGIAVFGGAFAWLARQTVINRALVAVGGLGKLGYFFTTAAYWLAGDLPFAMVGSAVVPDLLLGARQLRLNRGSVDFVQPLYRESIWPLSSRHVRGPPPPIAPSERHEVLDALRGLALFGILFVNLDAGGVRQQIFP